MKELLYPSISIITATLNVAVFIPTLIESLKNQLDSDFQWIVADGDSSDGTIDLLEHARESIPSLIIDSRPDNGISEAINRAIKLARTDYYIILGADDYLKNDAIFNFKQSLRKHKLPDVLVAKVVTSNGVILKPRKPNWLWLYGSTAKIGSTSIGTVYKRDLNERIGFFDTRYKINADGLFMLKIILNGSIICYDDFIAGVFYIGGVSNNNPYLSYTEELRAKLSCGFNVYVQLFIFCAKILRAYYRQKLKDL